MDLNRTLLAGTLTREPEFGYTRQGSGPALANFGLRVNRHYLDSQERPREDVLFIQCAAWGKHAEAINRCHEGDAVLVEGRLVLESWDDKQTGERRERIGLVLEAFPIFLPQVFGSQTAALSEKHKAQVSAHHKTYQRRT
jgi:single-strand DNA-binding protein